VRQAIASAIDYKGIAGGPYQGYATTPSGILPPNVGHYTAPSVPSPTQDLAKARQLLAGAGVSTSGTYNVVYDSGQANDALVAQILQQNLAAVGIKLKLTGLETGAFVDDAFGLKADMVLWSYGAISPDMFDPIGWVLGTSWLFTGADTKPLKAQYDAYNAAQSDAAKDKIITQIQNDSLQNDWSLPLANFQVLQGVSGRVKGFASSPWGMYYWDPIWLKG
jgi:peptide/nickel transport system substrate-binding protein